MKAPVRGRAMIAALLLAGQGALAEAPVESLRPEGRAVPGARQGLEASEAGLTGEAGVRYVAEADAGPVALAEPPTLSVPSVVAAAPEPRRDFLPAVPRQPPLLETEPPLPVFVGLAGIVRAELLFSGPPPVAVVVDGWAGVAPPSRPEAEPAGAPAPMRPLARPRAAGSPAPEPPPEPEAPAAYAPAPDPEFRPLGPDVTVFAVAFAVMPGPRPPEIVDRAERVSAERARGQVCGNPLIQGAASGPVGGGGCGIDGPVVVRSVDGVRLSTPATVDCTTAEALLEWVQDGARPALGSRGGGLAGLEIMGSYVCRSRNNQAGAKLSEHGLGRAVDIGAVILADGSRLNVARDWPDPALVAMHRAACGAFSTTLGPGSDGYHEDHLHYDTARGRGPYCR